MNICNLFDFVSSDSTLFIPIYPRSPVFSLGLTSHNSLKDEQVDTKIQRSIGYFMFKLQTTSITAMLPPIVLPRLHSHLSCRVAVTPMPIVLPRPHSHLSCHGVLLPIVLLSPCRPS